MGVQLYAVVQRDGYNFMPLFNLMGIQLYAVVQLIDYRRRQGIQFRQQKEMKIERNVYRNQYTI